MRGPSCCAAGQSESSASCPKLNRRPPRARVVARAQVSGEQTGRFAHRGATSQAFLLAAACLAAAVTILSPGAPALAADRASFADRYQLESTIDVSTLGAVSGDVTLTVSPLAKYWESGPRIRLTGAVARYQYWGDSERLSRVTGVDRSLEALLGYSFALHRADHYQKRQRTASRAVCRGLL